MKKIWLAVGVISGGAWLGMAQAAPGEWWEITTKAEMQGMPFAMPAQTMKICMAKGAQADPKQTQGKDGNCKISDMQQSGNTVKFKGVCVNNGETMNMEGQTSHDGNSFKSSAKMTGKSHGEPVNMTSSTIGKRIGGACDTEERDEKFKKLEEQGKQVQAQNEKNRVEFCERSNTYKTLDWVMASDNFIGKAPYCPGKKEKLCSVVRNDVPKDFKAFDWLIKANNSSAIAKECNVNITAMAKSMCKSRALKGPQEFLDKYCPSEAKSYRELMRKMDACAERGYTAGDELKKCMNGPIPENDEPDSDESSSDSRSSDSGSGSRSGDSINADSVLQGAKKLKGLFGF